MQTGNMAGQLHLSPLENGLDYLRSAVDGLVGEPDARAVKYAVLHLAAGIEVLAKHRLLAEHWTLVVSKPDDAKLSRSAFDRGEFVSVSGEIALKRLRNLVGLPLHGGDLGAVSALQKLRNKLQHFEVNESVAAVISLSTLALDFALRFINDHLLPDADEADADTIEDALPEIRKKLGEIQTFVDHRMAAIARDLADSYGSPATCPRCSQRALIADTEPRCLFCGQTWRDGAGAATEYADVILGLSWHETQNGGEPPTTNCSECGDEAVVWDHFEGAHSAVRSAMCFACGEHFDETCSRCAAPISTGDDGPSICADCLDELVHKD